MCITLTTRPDTLREITDCGMYGRSARMADPTWQCASCAGLTSLDIQNMNRNMKTCLRSSVSVCVRVCMHVCICAYIKARMHTVYVLKCGGSRVSRLQVGAADRGTKTESLPTGPFPAQG